MTKDEAVALAEEPDARADMEARGWRVVQSSRTSMSPGVEHVVEATKAGAYPGVKCAAPTMTRALEVALETTRAIDRVGHAESTANAASELRDHTSKMVSGVIADPGASSLKRIAWAYGCARRGSADEAALRDILVDRIRNGG